MQVKSFFNLINISLLLICLFSGILLSCKEDISLNSPNGLVVILKADDLGDTTANWNRFIKKIIDDSICAGIGVISKNVHESSIPEIQRISNIRQKNGFPVIEFWNHGYDHSNFGKKTEFYGNNFNYQLSHLLKAQGFFSDSLHIPNHSFGAPYNRTSHETSLALNQIPDINVWMCFKKFEKQYSFRWKDPNKLIIYSFDKHIILNVNYESVFGINKDLIVGSYDEDKKKSYIIIQIHPAVWDNDTYNKFDSIIQFYKQPEHKAIFMTPYQYYESLHKNLTMN